MGKIISIPEIQNLVSALKGKKIVLAGGCFDLLHIGHIEFLKAAKNTGDVLILLLESDAAIKNLKGEKRPINNQTNRAQVLSAIEFVDFIIPLPEVFQNPDYQKLIEEIRPNIIAVTEGDKNITIKKQHAQKVGGEVKIVLNQIPEHSTTKLLDYF